MKFKLSQTTTLKNHLNNNNKFITLNLNKYLQHLKLYNKDNNHIDLHSNPLLPRENF